VSGALLQSSPVGCGLVVGARVGSRQSADDQVQVRAPRASIFRGIGAAATSAGGRSLGAAASARVEGWKGAEVRARPPTRVAGAPCPPALLASGSLAALGRGRGR